MMNENMEKVVFLTLVVERKQKDAILTALLDAGIHLINIIYGKGTVNENYFMNTFGLVPERNKAVITCVSTYAKANAVLEVMIKKFHFDKPNTGIAFIMPVDRVSF